MPVSWTLSEAVKCSSFTCFVLAVATTCSAQGTVNAASVNGVLNPIYFSGSDIGAQVNAAWASGAGKTVRIPVGTYSNVVTTINHPGAGYALQCDAGAVINYTGSGDAISLPKSTLVAVEGAEVDGQGGCLINGTSTGHSGISIPPSNHVSIKNIRIEGFSNGYGIYDAGGNSVGISRVDIRANRTGIYLTGSPYGSGYAANGVRIYDSDISNNAQWGIDSENAHCACTWNLGNQIVDNVIENNGYGGVELNWDRGGTVAGNYFENSGVNLGLGNGNDNIYSMTVIHNYFSSSSANPETISLGYGIGFHFEDNSQIGVPSTACLINETYGSLGSVSKVRGVGTNFPPANVYEFCNHGTSTTTP